MWHSGMRVIQDPVHGLMDFVRSEAFILDLLRCSELQRLRRIKQLGFACFVFPGAEHSRFSHAIGTAYLAARVGRHLDAVAREALPGSLRPDGHALQDLCVAGLCHDLGHGPFSHVWERVVIGADWNRKQWAQELGLPGRDTDVFKNWHEMVTYAFIMYEDGQLHMILEQTEKGRAERVASLLSGRYYLPYLSALVASDVDVDRCDYLLRDAKMAGLPSCGFQLDRLIACLTFGFDDTGTMLVGLNENKGLPVAIELLNARAEMHQVLYFHKTILGMEWLLGNLLRRLRDISGDDQQLDSAGAVPRSLLEMLEGRPVGVDALLELDDYAIWMLVRKAGEVTNGDPTAVGLAQRLMERDPLRTVRVDSDRLEAFFADDHAGRHDMVAEVVAKYVEGDPYYFVRDFPVSFDLWEQDTACRAVLISQDRERHASFLSEHPRLHELFPNPKQRLGRRLLVPREAREEVEKLISP